MKIESKIFALVLASVLIGTVAVNQVYAPRGCGGCTEFKKLTHEFEKAVIDAAIGDPNEGPAPHLIPGLLQSYSDSVMRIFLGGPDTIPGLLEQYQQAVLRVFQAPPEGDKRAQHDQIKEFRLLTHAFEKAVIGAISDPED